MKSSSTTKPSAGGPGRPTPTKRGAGRSGAATKPAPTAGKSQQAKGKNAQASLPKPHVEEAVATKLLRDAYVRERHYFLMRLIMVMSVLLAASVFANLYLSTRPVEHRYFATDTDGRIRPLVALDQPIMSINEILNWATNAITKTYTFSFANYRQELQAAQVNFTPAGWRGFERALEQSRILKSVIDNRFVTTAVPTGAPVVVAEGLVNGRYAWRIQIPIMVTYQSASRTAHQSLMITATILRQSETEHPTGLGIAQIIAE